MQAVLGQPGLELAGGFHFFLQRAQGLQARGQLGLARAFIVDLLLALAARFVELGHAVLQFLQSRLGQFGGFAGLVELLLQLGQLLRIGHHQGLAIGAHALAAGLLLAALLVQAALLGGQHLDVLLHLHHHRALAGGAGLGLLQRFVQLGLAHGVLFQLGLQDGSLLLRVHVLAFELLQLGAGILLARIPLHHLGGQLCQALLHALAPFHHVANFCLQLADFGTGFVELGLGLVDGVARVVVRLAQQL